MDDLVERLRGSFFLINVEAADEIERLNSEVAHWKSNHADQVKRTAILRERPDLPVDRIPAYRELERLQELEKLFFKGEI